MNILHLVSSLSVSSGIMCVIMNYYRHIDRQYCNFTFGYFKEYEEKDTFYSEIKSLGGNTVRYLNPKSLFKFRKSFEESLSNIDVVHIHEAYLLVFVSDILRKKRIKVVTHAHTTKFSDSKLAAFRNKILCFPTRFISDGLLACSYEAGKAYFGKKSKFQVLPNGIEVSKYKYNPNFRSQIRKELNISDKTFVIGHVGRLCKQKNQFFLLDCYKEINTVFEDCALIIIGEGPLDVELKEYVAKNEIRNVRFLGRKANVNQYYNAFDVFMLPSLFEGLGIVLIEAQVNGLPCFVSEFIPKEACISKGYSAISIFSNPCNWRDNIKERTFFSVRKNNAVEIEYDDFDIEKNAFKLVSYYESLFKVD